MTENPSGEPEVDVFANLNQLTRLMHDLDERGLILSLAAFAEEALGELIRAFLRQAEASNQLLDGFNAPLGTLSSRIKMAFSLGLVTEEQFRDLECLRKIRNEFSHSWQPISFGDQRIAALIQNLNYSLVDEEFPDNPTKKVRSSLGFLLVELSVTTTQIEKKRLGVKENGSRLVAGLNGTTDQQLELCKTRLDSLKIEIQAASGEHRRFLLLRWKAWLDKILLVTNVAVDDDRARIIKMHLQYSVQQPF